MGCRKFVVFNHHGREVVSRSDLQGKHRDHCLCHSCALFKPGEDDNCPIAEDTFANCTKHGLVTPVYECPDFEEMS